MADVLGAGSLIRDVSGIWKPMESAPQSVERRPPVCGVSSLLAPFVGAAVAFAEISSSTGGERGMAYFVNGLLIFTASLVIGVILGVTAATRRERLRALPWIALPLNAALLCYCILTFWR